MDGAPARLMSSNAAIRRAVSGYLEARGQELVKLSGTLSWKVWLGRGLSNRAVGLKAVAKSADGTINEYLFAWDARGGFVGERSGLKRYAQGAWFDAR